MRLAKNTGALGRTVSCLRSAPEGEPSVQEKRGRFERSTEPVSKRGKSEYCSLRVTLSSFIGAQRMGDEDRVRISVCRRAAVRANHTT